MRRKNLFIAAALLLAACPSFAQQVTAEEPEFMNSYCILTSDSTYALLPKESGTIKQHKSILQKAVKIGGAVVDAAGAVGGIMTYNAGSLTGMVDGVKTMGTAANVGDIANSVGALAAADGKDIAFKGGHSPYVLPAGTKTVRLLIKAPNNENDPLELYRIVRFNAKKKERTIKWQEFSPALLGSDEKEDAGYVYFTAHKYGAQSYLITIPEKELKPGEYGIFYMSLASATDVPVGTFSISK